MNPRPRGRREACGPVEARWAPAAKTYVAAAELFRLAGDDGDVALALCDAADAFDEDGQPEIALQHWQTAVELYRLSGDDEAAANNANRRAGKLATNRRFEEALGTQHRHDLAHALAMLSRIELDAGGPGDEWQRVRAVALYASVGNLNQAKRLSELFLTPEYAARRQTSPSSAPPVAEQRQPADVPETAAVRD